jgi:hypothetical protein
MLKPSYGSMIPHIIYYSLFIYVYHFVFGAAACVKHPADYVNIVIIHSYLFIYNLFI